jgi:hypothetical protein
MSKQYWNGAITHKGQSVRVVLEVDVRELLLQLGHKAANSKGGKCIEAGGLVKVKVVQRLPLSDTPQAAHSKEEA